jgi:hypothetical protein
MKSSKKTKTFPHTSNKKHIEEMDNYVHQEKQEGRVGKNGRPYTRTDYINEALENYAKVTGLKSEP